MINLVNYAIWDFFSRIFLSFKTKTIFILKVVTHFDKQLLQ